MAALLIGYGNQGRGDDGLGPVFAGQIEALALPRLYVDIDYQLTVDHALTVAGAELVVFVDAQLNGTGAFGFEPVTFEGITWMGSHELSPQAVLALAKSLYGKTPPAYVLGISGWAFGEVREGLSAQALMNLEEAKAFFLDWYAAQQPVA